MWNIADNPLAADAHLVASFASSCTLTSRALCVKPFCQGVGPDGMKGFWEELL